MYLLDTNICIYLMKGTYPVLNERILARDPCEVAISTITVFELEYGASKSNWGQRTREKLLAFLSPFVVLSFDAGDAIAAGGIRADLAAQGTPIGPYDILIAAQGLKRGFVVVTHNVGEFSRVRGLRIEDWTV